MNERIRELLRRSHLDVYSLGKDRDNWESRVEKFAELIVNECAIKLSEVPGGFDSTVYYQVSSKLEQHFGV